MSIDHEVTPPSDAPTSLHRPGPDPLRVLLLGDGPAVGYAVLSHELALAGHLARAIASATSRGVVVDVRAESRMTPTQAFERLGEVRLERYDAVVLTLGTHDAIRRSPTRSWGREMAELVERVDRRTGGRAPIVVGSVPELSALLTQPAVRAARTRTHADMLNVELASLAFPDSAVVVQLSSPPNRRAESPTERRRRWAGDLVSGLGPLHRLVARPAPSPTRSSERRRQESLRRTGVLAAPCPDALDDIVSALQRSLGASSAALNFIDDARLWVKASRGFPFSSIPRNEALCDHTIRAPRTLVVPDASADLRFREIPFVREQEGAPFYAGHPVESPDGERVGSLCILDRDRPRFTDDEILVLQKLAFRVQNELYATA